MLLIMSCSFFTGNVELLGTGKVVDGRAQHGWGFPRPYKRRTEASGLFAREQRHLSEAAAAERVDKPILLSAEVVRVTARSRITSHRN